jgi:hypothetical protein
LFKKLKEFRSETASAKKIPPYAVFHDNTLTELARIKPKNKTDLMKVPGIGQKKADSYGDALLRLIHPKENSKKPEKTVTPDTKKSPKIQEPPKDPEKKKKARAGKWTDDWTPDNPETVNFVKNKIIELGSMDEVNRFYSESSLVASYARRIAADVLAGSSS